MKKLFILLFFLALSVLCYSQASGGQIKRTPSQKSISNKRVAKVQIRKPSDVYKTFNIEGIAFKMIRVDGGSFIMGGTEEQGNDVDVDERPIHQVTLSTFFIGETEVTQALWEAVMGDNPSCFKRDDLPVENVSWYDCQEFIDNINMLTGLKFRLPTEAEWEFAARGGNSSQFYKYSGSNNLNNVAWHEENSGGCLHPVKSKNPNELMLYDMNGNVSEWCYDWYNDYGEESQINPTAPQNKSLRVVRGGSFFHLDPCRISKRSNRRPEHKAPYTGFRLALTIPEK